MAEVSDTAEHSPDTLRDVLSSSLCRETAVVNLTVDPRMRATIKVVTTVLQCIEAACEGLGEKAGAVLCLLEGFHSGSLEGACAWDAQSTVHYTVVDIAQAAEGLLEEDEAEDEDEDTEGGAWVFRSATTLPAASLLSMLELPEDTRLIQIDGAWPSPERALWAVRDAVAGSPSSGEGNRASAVVDAVVTHLGGGGNDAVFVFRNVHDGAALCGVLQAIEEGCSQLGEACGVVMAVLVGYTGDVVTGNAADWGGTREEASDELITFAVSDIDAGTATAAQEEDPTAEQDLEQGEEEEEEEEEEAEGGGGGWIFRAGVSLEDAGLHAQLEMPADTRVARLDSRAWSGLALAGRDLRNLLGVPGGSNLNNNPDDLVELLTPLVRSDLILVILVEAGRRATVKVVNHLLQCVEAACEQLGEEAGTCLAVLEGYGKDELEGTSVWEAGADLSYSVTDITHAAEDFENGEEEEAAEAAEEEEEEEGGGGWLFSVGAGVEDAAVLHHLEMPAETKVHFNAI